MAISRDLIIDPADIRVSMQCKTCNARVEISRRDIDPSKKRDISEKCPSCADDWKDFLFACRDLFGALAVLESNKVTFHVSEGPQDTTRAAGFIDTLAEKQPK